MAKKVASGVKIVSSFDVDSNNLKEDYLQYSFNATSSGVIKKGIGKSLMVFRSFQDYEFIEKKYEANKIRRLPEEIIEIIGYVRGSLRLFKKYTEIMIFKSEGCICIGVSVGEPEPHELLIYCDYVEKAKESDGILNVCYNLLEKMSDKYGSIDRVCIKSKEDNLPFVNLSKSKIYEGYRIGDGRSIKREVGILIG